MEKGRNEAKEANWLVKKDDRLVQGALSGRLNLVFILEPFRLSSD